MNKKDKTSKPKVSKPKAISKGRVRKPKWPCPMPSERQSITHHFRVGTCEGYLNVGLYPDGQPGELFLVVQKWGTVERGLLNTLAIMISVALQHGVPVKKVVDKLKGIRSEPCGVTGNKEIPMARSVVDYLARWLECKFLTPQDPLAEGSGQAQVEVVVSPC